MISRILEQQQAFTQVFHLENKKSYVRMLFVDYSSAFNTIIPDILYNKLLQLQIPLPTCTWIKNFLTSRPQSVRLGPHQSSTLTLSTGSPQGCVLSPLLYALYTYDCTPIYLTNHIIKYADDTTVVGCIYEGDETAYRAEVKELSRWCSDNNLTLNILKTKELILDFRKHRQDYTPLLINGEQVEIVSTFRFLGTYLSADYSWTYNIRALVKKAQQRLLPACPQEEQYGHKAAACILSLLCVECTNILFKHMVCRLHS